MLHLLNRKLGAHLLFFPKAETQDTDALLMLPYLILLFTDPSLVLVPVILSTDHKVLATYIFLASSHFTLSNS